jgi:hypothetical protein
MRIDQEFEATLKDIETAVISIYKRNRDMTDYAVLRAYEAAAAYYHDLARQRQPKERKLSGLDETVRQAVLEAAARWHARLEPGRPPSADKLTAEQMLACIRRLAKSTKFWTTESGRQGYLDYIRRFVP